MTQKGCYQAMHPKMSQITRQAVLVRKPLQWRSKPVSFTRSRPYRRNDNAHIEQKNFIHGRLWFGYQRPHNPQVVPLINALCNEALNHLPNSFQPTVELEHKQRTDNKVIRQYGQALTPLSRVLASLQVNVQIKARLRPQKQQLNLFCLAARSGPPTQTD